MDHDVSARPFSDQRCQSLGGDIDVTLEGHRPLHLKEFRAGERAQQDLSYLRAEPVPGVTADALQFDIRDDSAHAQRLAAKIDAQRVPHEAAAAVGANEVAGAHDLASNLRSDAFGVLREAGQLPPELHLVSEPGETLAHHCFGEEPRHHERRAIRFGRCGAAGVADWCIGKTAVPAVFAYRRIRASGRERPVDDVVVLKHFQTAGLDPLAARAAESRFRLIDQPEVDAAPGEVDRQRQPGRTGARDEYVGG